MKKMNIVELNLALQGYIKDPAINIVDLSTERKIILYKELFNEEVELINNENSVKYFYLGMDSENTEFVYVNIGKMIRYNEIDRQNKDYATKLFETENEPLCLIPELAKKYDVDESNFFVKEF